MKTPVRKLFVAALGATAVAASLAFGVSQATASSAACNQPGHLSCRKSTDCTDWCHQTVDEWSNGTCVNGCCFCD